MSLERLDWLLARGSGFTALLLLTAAVVAGLAMSMRWASARWPGVVTNELHRLLTTLALWATGLHLLMLLVDAKSGMGLRDLLVPLSSAYRPLATSLGIIALYTVLAVIVSTKLRARIGYARWRRLHGLAFLAYGAALFHGILAGRDTGAPWSTFVYLASATFVGGLTLIRVMTPRGAARPPTTPPFPAAARRASGEVASPQTPGGGLPPLAPRPVASRRELPPLRP